MKLRQQYSSGFRAAASMQHGFAGSQQMSSTVGVIQNRRVNPSGETGISNMNQTLSSGADRQQAVCGMFQQQDMIADHCQQTAGFAGHRPRHYAAAPGQHSVSMNVQPPTSITDAFTGSYQHRGVMQPSHSVTVQQQMLEQQLSWDEPRSRQPYTHTGCFTVVTVFHTEDFVEAEFDGSHAVADGSWQLAHMY